MMVVYGMHVDSLIHADPVLPTLMAVSACVSWRRGLCVNYCRYDHVSFVTAPECQVMVTTNDGHHRAPEVAP